MMKDLLAFFIYIAIILLPAIATLERFGGIVCASLARDSKMPPEYDSEVSYAEERAFDGCQMLMTSQQAAKLEPGIGSFHDLSSLVAP